MLFGYGREALVAGVRVCLLFFHDQIVIAHDLLFLQRSTVSQRSLLLGRNQTKRDQIVPLRCGRTAKVGENFVLQRFYRCVLTQVNDINFAFSVHYVKLDEIGVRLHQTAEFGIGLVHPHANSFSSGSLKNRLEQSNSQ